MARHWIDDETGAYCVNVCQFTFRFRSSSDIEEAIAFYRQKLHPSSRLPTPDQVSAEARRDPKGFRRWFERFISCHHSEIQRWYEKVPLRLQKEGKRQKVVAALERALQAFG